MTINDETRPVLTDADVWQFISEGCNESEIAAFAGVSDQTARALMAHARAVYALQPDLDRAA